ncbi:MAG: NAD-dependent epimerase/dehydratase family protein, partial [Thermoleophilia bacterium]|nr:NAD-dependent epimerase/dehydratase family protein [Thermoleophilia bacterium]
MSETILVTGGCGFIGSHLVDRLVDEGYRVRVLDNLDPQVHPTGRPEHANAGAEYLIGDVGDEALLDRVLVGVDALFHFAAAVGVGQSMYQIRKYTAANTLGTATLLDRLARRERGSLRKLIVASSMSVYGEGAYRCSSCSSPAPVRDSEMMAAGEWEPVCLHCATPLVSQPTTEDHSPNPTSVYALNKLDQEKLCLIVGQAYSIPTVALRFFNVYGPRQ